MVKRYYAEDLFINTDDFWGCDEAGIAAFLSTLIASDWTNFAKCGEFDSKAVLSVAAGIQGSSIKNTEQLKDY
jgi:hypothetical protein